MCARGVGETTQTRARDRHACGKRKAPPPPPPISLGRGAADATHTATHPRATHTPPTTTPTLPRKHTRTHPAHNTHSFKKELKKRKIPQEDYSPHEPSGLRIYDLEEGRGKAVAMGDTVKVHFDCVYRGIDAVSSRYARTLGGNRTVAEPLEFVVGEFVSGSQMKTVGDSGGGGLFSGSPGPKPPQAISKAVVGMKPGGRRAVIVDVPELGYPKGNQEIPPGETFELRIELLRG